MQYGLIKKVRRGHHTQVCRSEKFVLIPVTLCSVIVFVTEVIVFFDYGRSVDLAKIDAKCSIDLTYLAGHSWTDKLFFFS